MQVFSKITTQPTFYAQPVTVVRKEFRGSNARANFLAENSLLKGLSERLHPAPDTILTALCSFAVSDPWVFNIMFEPAEYSLSTYLSDGERFPNGTTEKRLENVSRMIGVAAGLKWFSKSLDFETESGKFEASSFLHRDLRPENILVCKNERSRKEYGEFVFKISDFGRALKIPRVAEVGRPGSSSTGSEQLDTIGGTYAAPEPALHETSDVWSFGCILLVILTFNYEGVAGLNELMSSLIRDSKIDGFYDRRSQKANDETSNCIEHLRDCSETGSDKLVTQNLLKLLEDDVFIAAQKRATISKVGVMMKQAYNRKNLITQEVIYRTHKAIAKGAHHCAHSPGGKFEMFHTHRDTYGLLVYHSDFCTPLPLIKPISPPKLQESRRSHRVYPRSDSCGAERICQVISNEAPIEVPSLFVLARARTDQDVAFSVHDTTQNGNSTQRVH